MSNVYLGTFRLNLNKEADRNAWDHLQHYDRGQYRSISHVIIAAVNKLFDSPDDKELSAALQESRQIREETASILLELRRIEQKHDNDITELRALLCGISDGGAASPDSSQPSAACDAADSPVDLSAALEFVAAF